MDKELRYLNSEFRADEESRHISGYAVRFNEPSEFLGFYETISPSAIDEDTLKRSDIFCLLNHQGDKVLARSKYGIGNLKLSIDDKGLRYEFDALDNEIGNTTLSYVRSGIIDSSSFAFTLPTDDEDCQVWKRDKEGVLHREIRKIDRLWDCSPVFSPAYSTTSCSCRSLDEYLEKEKENELNEKYNKMIEEINKL